MQRPAVCHYKDDRLQYMDLLFITTLQEAGEDMEASVPYNILSFEPHIK